MTMFGENFFAKTISLPPLPFCVVQVNMMSKYFIQTLWKIMYNYHQIKLWHEQYDSKSTTARIDREDAEVAFNRNYVRQKLEHGLLRVWRVRKMFVVQWLGCLGLGDFSFNLK